VADSSSPKPKVVVAVQPSVLETVFPASTLSKLEQFAEPVILGRSGQITADRLAEAIRDAQAVITCWGTPKVTAEMASAARELRIIAHAAGSVKAYVDKELLRQGIVVTSQAGAIANAVAEFTIGLILLGLRLTWRSDRLLQATHKWKEVRPPLHLAWELAGRTVGVVSLSRVGMIVAKRLADMEAKVLAYDPYADEAAFAACRARPASLEDLFRNSSVVTLHAPLTDETRGMITAGLLRLLPDGALLVNTARGGIIDHAALEAELVSGRIRAALDVTDPEPPPEDSPLFGLENVMLTPHQAGLSVEARLRQGLGAVEDVRRALQGQPVTNAIRPEQWDVLA